MESQEQDNVTGGEWEYYFNQHKRTFQGINAGEYIDDEDFEIFAKYLQSRIQSLETANAFHKQAAHEAIQEQYRLQKEVDACKEILKYMSVIEEMKDSDYKNFCEALKIY